MSTPKQRRGLKQMTPVKVDMEMQTDVNSRPETLHNSGDFFSKNQNSRDSALQDGFQIPF
jgi:hypothetical protein